MFGIVKLLLMAAISLAGHSIKKSAQYIDNVYSERNDFYTQLIEERPQPQVVVEVEKPKPRPKPSYRIVRCCETGFEEIDTTYTYEMASYKLKQLRKDRKGGYLIQKL